MAVAVVVVVVVQLLLVVVVVVDCTMVSVVEEVTLGGDESPVNPVMAPLSSRFT